MIDQVSYLSDRRALLKRKYMEVYMQGASWTIFLGRRSQRHGYYLKLVYH